ncbi:MAG: hypothetical protein ACM3XP_04630, partial [Nitrososphaerales archaeon]
PPMYNQKLLIIDKDKGNDDNSSYKTCLYFYILYYYKIDSYFRTAIGITPDGPVVFSGPSISYFQHLFKFEVIIQTLNV